jgi:hypothetical protein
LEGLGGRGARRRACGPIRAGPVLDLRRSSGLRRFRGRQRRTRKLWERVKIPHSPAGSPSPESGAGRQRSWEGCFGYPTDGVAVRLMPSDGRPSQCIIKDGLLPDDLPGARRSLLSQYGQRSARRISNRGRDQGMPHGLRSYRFRLPTWCTRGQIVDTRGRWSWLSTPAPDCAIMHDGDYHHMTIACADRRP